MKQTVSPLLFLVSFLLGYLLTDKEMIRENNLSIIPKPNSITVNHGKFELNSETKIILSDSTDEIILIGEYLNSNIRKLFNKELEIKIGKKNKGNVIYLLKAKDEQLGSEGYKLNINEDGIFITGGNAGLFYGVETLMQLLPPDVFGNEDKSFQKAEVPFVEINDRPRFSWRGMHLDVGRHMFPVNFIKKYIDLLAFHKMNVFHWHLTEDQGWRIEIKKYPKLSEISAFRDETIVGHHRSKPQKFDGKKYGGFYTQDEIREVVQYAKDRFITVVPEIEMPGHSVAALTAYPELSCTGGPFKVRTSWGISKDIYCAGKEEIFHFLENVLSEVIDLFPSKYIHIGGDEAPKERWENCKDCQKRIEEEGLKNAHELQSYFIKRIEKFLNSKGKQIVGWDEILEGGLAPNATVMSWRGNEGGIAAAKSGHNVVMTPTSFCYFDYYQSSKKEKEPIAIGGYLPLEKVYSFNPVPEELNEEESKYVIGAQGNVWTEYMRTPEKVEYMAIPRMSAMAEVTWTNSENKNYKDFKQRMNKQYKRFDALKINYFGKEREGR